MTTPATFTEAAARRVYEELGVTEHPILKLPSPAALAAALGSEAGKATLIELLRERGQRIALAEADPLNWGFELAPWADADWLLGKKTELAGPAGPAGAGSVAVEAGISVPEAFRQSAPDCEILALFGGNRASKTWYAVKRACQAGDACPRSLIPITAESWDASKAMGGVQDYVWRYFAPKYRHLLGKRHAVYKVNYSQANGFADGQLVLPNGTEFYFLTYNQDPGSFEGWEFGSPVQTYERVLAERLAKGLPWFPNVGAVCDEAMPLAWLNMFSRRLSFRQAKLLWTFTPVKGITPAIKELVGSSAQTLESRPSELLPRQNLPDLPAGHMPYIRRCAFRRAYAIYFHTRFSPFGPRPGWTYYQELVEKYREKTSDLIERVLYGFARDTIARAVRKFGAWNVVKRSQLPAVGTNYFFVDPAGTRNWFMFWVRVAPGNPASLYIYRDWPDARTYGEWAVPTERETSEESRRGWDGDPGPAQIGMGQGVVALKKLILAAERHEKDPYADRGEDPYWARLKARAAVRGEAPVERIEERFVDPRAGASEHLAEDGGTCIVDEFADEQVDGQGLVIGPRMDLTPASGVGRRTATDENEGWTLVNELLDWDQQQPLCAVLNQPHLFVSEDCEQVRWMFENFTGLGGEKGACKDPADLARYMALAKLEYVPEGGKAGRHGGGF